MLSTYQQSLEMMDHYSCLHQSGQTLLQTPPQVLTHLPESPTSFIPSPNKSSGELPNFSRSLHKKGQFQLNLKRALYYHEDTPSTASNEKRYVEGSGSENNLLNPNVTPFNCMINDKFSKSPQPFRAYNANLGADQSSMSNEELLKHLQLSVLKPSPRQKSYQIDSARFKGDRENIKDSNPSTVLLTERLNLPGNFQTALKAEAQATAKAVDQYSQQYLENVHPAGLNKYQRHQAVIDPSYKTELCKNWQEFGHCRYGTKCRFAHGHHELINKQIKHQNYKTKKCKKFEKGYCPYGFRCLFRHEQRTIEDFHLSKYEFALRFRDWAAKLQKFKRLQVFENLCKSNTSCEEAADSSASPTVVCVQ